MEVWKPIKEFEGIYEVSDLGRVRSIDRVVHQLSRTGVPYTRIMRGKLLTLQVDSAGKYLLAHLANKSKQHVLVHLLVLRAFVGDAPDGCEGCHSDGNNQNNLLSNLRWDTHLNNEKDKEHHQTRLRGESIATSVLTEELVRAIKQALQQYSGKPYGKYGVIAKMYGVPSKAVGEIARNRIWKHVL